MSREILFRGKRIDTNEWVEGSLIIIKDRYKNIPGIEYEILIPLEYCTMTNFDPYRDKRKDIRRDFLSVNVDPETVGQFTGLLDKNGKKIFEGDYVLYTRKYDDGNELNILVLIKDIRQLPEDLFGSSLKCLEVLGIIHDNPELLGGK